MSRLSLDHIGIMGAALGPLSADYERLGFQLSRPSQHYGARTPGAAVEKWGTGNRCIMLRSGYIELLAVVEPALFQNRVPEYLARYAGAHIVAFGCEDAAAEAARLSPAGLASGVARLERPLPPEDGGQTLRFDLVRLDQAAVPEGRVLLIHHLTPELLWQPALLDHPNGALALEGVAVAVPDLDEAARRFQAVLGTRGVAEDGAVRFDLAAGRFRLVAAGASDRFGMSSPPALPFVGLMEVRVADLDHTAALLRANGVTTRRGDGALLVPANEAGGIACRFSDGT